MICACCGTPRGDESTCSACGEASWTGEGTSAPAPSKPKTKREKKTTTAADDAADNEGT